MSGGIARTPAGWRKVPLGELCEKRIRTREPRDTPDKPFTYVDISSVDNAAKRIIAAKKVRGGEASSRARQVIRAGDVLVSTTRPNLNAVALVPRELDDQIASTGFCVLRPLPTLDGEFLFAFVQAREFVRKLSDLVKGALYPAVTDAQVRAQMIPLPPQDEQRRIAEQLRERLAAVSQVRVAFEQQLVAARALPASHLRGIFRSAPSDKWVRRRLGDIAAITGGVTLGRDLGGRSTRPVPYLRVANVKDGWLDLTQIKQTEATENEVTALRLQKGDLLLTEGGDPDKLGRGTYWSEEIAECIHQNHIFRVRLPSANFDPRFVAWQLGSAYGKEYFLRHAKQTTGIATINRRVLDAFPLMAPPLETQQAIAAQLESEFSASAELNRVLTHKLAEVEKLPAALLRAAFEPAATAEPQAP